MLTGTGLGDDAFLAHAARQHDLAEHVIHLVGAGVVELITLEINLRAAAVLGQALGEIERARPSDVMGEIPAHLGLERGVDLGGRVGLLQLQDQRHQGLGNEASAVNAEVAALVGAGAERVGLLLNGHALLMMLPTSSASAARAARTKARILSGSFSPGARSTPEDTSTARACVMRKASATLPASSPPESMKGTPGSRLSTRRQSNDLPSPPGRVASRGGRASNSSRSATPA